jgi:hypothetical protein
MRAKGKSLEERLERARLVVTNARQDSVIKEAVSRYNYDEARLQQGVDLYKEAVRLYQEQKQRQAEKTEATRSLEQKWRAARQQYNEHRQLARLCFRGDASIGHMLGLSGRRKRRLAGWLEEARQFYTNGLGEPAVIEAMARYGVSRQDLEGGLSLVGEVERAAALQEKAKGLAHKATQQRNAAFREMERWTTTLIRIARLALGKESQHLEKLGIVVPSTVK